jgi:hypothetical protein
MESVQRMDDPALVEEFSRPVVDVKSPLRSEPLNERYRCLQQLPLFNKFLRHTAAI